MRVMKAAVWCVIAVIAPALATQQRCEEECEKPLRVAGPTPPNGTRPHPYAIAQFPTPHKQYCKVGCSFFFQTTKRLQLCREMCDLTYEYKVTVGYSDALEVARFECRDGCAIGIHYCQQGYFCIDGGMNPCPAGTYRTDSTDFVQECTLCPAGRYAERDRGTSLDHCSKCPKNTYLNVTGSVSKADCVRCPPGTFAKSEGTPVCECITADSCTEEWRLKDHDTLPFEGRW